MGFLRPLALAAGMLTVVRMPVAEAGVEELRRSVRYYPLVGLAIGATPALLLLLPLPPGVRAALALAGWVAVTGSLHLDGWADCCDAAFAPPAGDAGRTRARRLEILKDPHLGTFGAVGLILLLLVKWSALAEAPAAAPMLAAPVGRWVMVWTLATHPSARSAGLAATLSGAPALAGATLSLAVAGGMGALLLPSGHGAAALSGVLAAGAAGAGVAALLARRFGGITGDVCGAAGEVAETVALLGLVPWTLS